MPDNRNEYEIIDKLVSIVNMIHKWRLINVYDIIYVYKSEKGRIIYELNINVCNCLMHATTRPTS